MGPEHHLLADDALMALDWARTRLDVALGAGLTCGAGPIFIGRGLMEKGEHVHDWAAEVDDPVTRSKVLASHGFLNMARSRPGYGRYGRQALEAAGDRSIPWRPLCYLLPSSGLLFLDPLGALTLIRLAEDALPESGADATDGAIIDLQRANVAIWQRDYRTALQLSRRNLRHTGLDPLTAMNINGAYLLSAVLCEEHDAVRHHLGDPDVEASRQAWLDRAPRGEHCLVSYEAIRGAARAWNGEHEAARRDLADALAMLGTDVMSGVDAEFLGAFAWGCLACGELDRAAELLDDTYSIARSPNTMLVLTEARERAIGVTDATTEARIADLTRRSGLFDTINRENRTRRMLDSELDRLHLR